MADAPALTMDQMMPNAPGVLTPQERPAVDAYADHDAIKDLVQKTIDDFKKGRDWFLMADWRNLHFYRGEQWIRPNFMSYRWRPSVVPKGTPTPMSNVFAPTIDAITTVFGRIEPQMAFAPGNPDEPEDRAAADVAKPVCDAIENEVDIRRVRQRLANWVGLTGGAWIEVGYDTDSEYGTRTVQYDRCTNPACGAVQPPSMTEVCGACQQGDLEPAVDEQGEPVGHQAPIGKMYMDVVPKFEAYFDPAIEDWRKHRKFVREKSVPIEDAKARWPQLADQIQPDVMGSDSFSLGETLSTLAPALDTASAGRRFNSQRPQNTRCTERWFYQMPNKTYPEGLLAIIVSKAHVAYAGPLPYRRRDADGQQRPFLNLVWFPQKRVSGTFWPKTVADDVAFKQAQRNRWESIIEACGMRVGMPTWLIPTQANVTGPPPGEPGATLRYNALGPGNAKPERIAGQGIPLAYLEFIHQIDKDIENIARTFDIVKGARPEGVSAGIALQILQERGLSSFAQLFIEWEASWSEVITLAIEIAREYWTEERFVRIKGRNGTWEVKKFLGADFSGRIDVRAEAGSSMPRSTLTDRAELEQLVALGVLPPPRIDPELQEKFLEIYGRTNMLESMALDVKNQVMENEAFEQLAQNPLIAQATPDDANACKGLDYPTLVAIFAGKGIELPEVRAAIDDHGIHARESKRFAKGESFRRLPKLVQVLSEKHAEYHDQLRIQQAAAIQGAVGPQGQPNHMAGYMAPPPAQTQPMNTSSSPARMTGDQGEMDHQMAGVTG